MNTFYGHILTENGFRKGYIQQQDKEQASVHFDKSNQQTPQHLIIPPFINAHTHIGDTFIREKNITLPKDLEQLVAPPDGLKHQLLATTDPEEIKRGMINGLSELHHHGTSTFIDFRENGITGIELLKEVTQNSTVQPIILGRPSHLKATKQETIKLLSRADGIAISSLRDWDYESVQTLSEETKKRNKIFALHASELIREPITPILDLNPDFIVHMTMATRNDLKEVKKHHIPLVICPRSNHFFGMHPNLPLIKEVKNTFFLGTDNLMFHPPSILQEIQCICELFPHLFSLEELLLKNTYNARSWLSTMHGDKQDISPSFWLVLNRTDMSIIDHIHGAVIE